MANYPVIIGVGQFMNHAQTLDDALEPIELMTRAARAADEDAGGNLLPKLDSLKVVNILSWPYPDAPGLLTQRLRSSPSQTEYTAVGGDTPQRLVNETAEAIVKGKTRLALIAGSEAMHSRQLARKADVRLPWPIRGNPEHVVGDIRPGFSDTEARHGAMAPVRMYPLFENAIRAHAGRTVEEHQAHLGQLCSRFTKVAAKNPYAWFPQERAPEEITTINPDNRWVCFPYPKLMNAIMQVDQAAAFIMTGSETARELGIPQARWIYVHGCGQGNDKWLVSDRVNYYTSTAIRAATGRALNQAGLTVDDIDMFDIYSCFPAAVQLGAEALGISVDDPRGLTLTGGLPYFGGAGNNYVSHSIAAAVQRLRESPRKKALITALGWFATKHSAGVYSATPPTGEWVRTDPEVDQDAIEAMESPPMTDAANGDATIETYTVAFGRDGDPELGIIIGRLDDGTRFWANTPADAELMKSMTREEFIGRKGTVAHDAATRKNTFIPR